MWKDALLITVSCVLFVQMGLSDAIQDVLHLHIKPLSCPKCLAYWSTLAYLLLSGYGGFAEVMAASFLFSYFALWLALVYDALAILYNKLYEYISKTSGAPEDAEADGRQAPASPSDEVPEMQ